MNWPFKREKTEELQQQLPTEVQDYYQAERREKAGLAWFLAGGTLLITVALALGAFFGGRWLYRKLANNTSSTNTTTQTTDQTPQAPEGGSQPTDGSTSTPTGQNTNTTPPTATTPSTTTPRTGPESDE